MYVIVLYLANLQESEGFKLIRRMSYRKILHVSGITLPQISSLPWVRCMEAVQWSSWAMATVCREKFQLPIWHNTYLTIHVMQRTWLGECPIIIAMVIPMRPRHDLTRTLTFNFRKTSVFLKVSNNIFNCFGQRRVFRQFAKVLFLRLKTD